MRLIAFLLFLFSSSAAAQNLLMNGSFEEENICTEYIKNCAPEGWISTSLTSDYYFADVKNAFDGEHFVGLMYSDGSVSKSTRKFKYVRSRIICGLRPGARYNLEFYIRSLHSGLDSIGIYFSDDDILFRKSSIINEQPQLWVKEGLVSSLVQQWQKVRLVYTATGSENFISIGDFKRKGHGFFRRPDLGKDFYFFIDDISLKPVNANEKTCDGAEKIRDEEYGFDERHGALEKLVYRNSKNPPPVVPSTVTVMQRIDTLVIPDVLFAVNSFALTEAAHHVLDSFVLKSSRLSIDSLIVEGHTDNTGSLSLNQKLSENRAASVAGYLQPDYKPVIRTRGWASEKPVGHNRTPSGRQKNRRVEIYIYVRDKD